MICLMIMFVIINKLSLSLFALLLPFNMIMMVMIERVWSSQHPTHQNNIFFISSMQRRSNHNNNRSTLLVWKVLLNEMGWVYLLCLMMWCNAMKWMRFSWTEKKTRALFVVHYYYTINFVFIINRSFNNQIRRIGMRIIGWWKVFCTRR